MNITNDWNALRKHYERVMPSIMSVPAYVYGVGAYEWDNGQGMVNMTPIEYLMWCDIRTEGLVMYPQVPVLNYFLDFANPVAKVAIECDGREFHDREKDRIRDANLAAIGWKVYRISGSHICRPGRDCEEAGFEMNESERLCRMIAQTHGLASKYIDEDEIEEFMAKEKIAK